MIRWLVVLALAGCGGKQQPAPAQPPPPAAQPAAPAAPAPAPPKPITRREQMMQDMAALTDEMCACKPADRECALRVQQKLADFGQDNEDLADVKPSDAERARAAELGERMAKCSAAALHSDVLSELAHFRDELCACKDIDCMNQVTTEMTAYTSAHPDALHAKLSDAEQKAGMVIAQQLGNCAQKLSAARTP